MRVFRIFALRLISKIFSMRLLNIAMAMVIMVAITGCESTRETAGTSEQKSTEGKEDTVGKESAEESSEEGAVTKERMDEIREKQKNETPERPRYNPSQPMTNDLVHTDLEIRFNWQKERVLGKATLDLTPYFYPRDSLYLDAQGFELKEVALVENDNKRSLDYGYDGQEIAIELDREYTREDTFTVFIDYTAKPTEREEGGSSAIMSDQGIFFIDPDSSNPDKPTQLWTQGETEHNSGWFPTRDQPNERMTQELAITVKDGFKTLSNGEKVYSVDNEDGTRTDHWKQELSQPPYLVMMAVGDFAVVEDSWRDSIPVNYWVEHDYRSSARDIFGESPEMLEFFSEKLGYDYPWAKYDQVVVRDFVSGAMENTSAVVFGSSVRKTKVELIDGYRESIIPHEMIHHWFGNVATLESWANLPLNEAFATYGEYMWFEHRYGRDRADQHNQQNLRAYLQSSRQGGHKNMIRFGYENAEGMFDAHSYQKGGRILHMLRKTVGDEAFWKSIEHYLHENAFEPVEIHELRIAFEEVTGRDLNWFFNQWFLDKGHPKLDISYEYINGLGEQTVIIEQTQDFSQRPVYKLPIKIDIYVDGEKTRHEVTIDEVKERFTFNVSGEPDLVNVDAQKMLLCEKTDNKPLEQYRYQYYNAPLYLDRYEAIQKVGREDDSLSAKVIRDALGDEFWYLRRQALGQLDAAVEHYPDAVRKKLRELSEDPKPGVRAQAIQAMNKHFEDAEMEGILDKALDKDSSRQVMGTAMEVLAERNPEKGLKVAERFEDTESSSLLSSVANVYADDGAKAHHDFFINGMKRISGFQVYNFINVYKGYVTQLDDEGMKRGIEAMADIGTVKGGGQAEALGKLGAIQVLQELDKIYQKRKMDLEAKLEKAKEDKKGEEGGASGSSDKTASLKEDLSFVKGRLEKISKTIETIKDGITNERILQYLGG